MRSLIVTVIGSLLLSGAGIARALHSYPGSAKNPRRTSEGNTMTMHGIIHGIRRLSFIPLSIGVLFGVCGAAFAGPVENIQLAQSPNPQRPSTKDTASQPSALDGEWFHAPSRAGFRIEGSVATVSSLPKQTGNAKPGDSKLGDVFFKIDRRDSPTSFVGQLLMSNGHYRSIKGRILQDGSLALQDPSQGDKTLSIFTRSTEAERSRGRQAAAAEDGRRQQAATQDNARRNAEMLKRKEAFLKKYGISEFADTEALFTDPFAFIDKRILMYVGYRGMETATSAELEIYAPRGVNPIGQTALAADVPRGTFGRQGDRYLFVGKVLSGRPLRVQLITAQDCHGRWQDECF
jgi:hypothetical protein